MPESMDRRRFWRSLLGRALPGTAPGAAHDSGTTIVRPPGALPEPEFLGRCAAGCRLCVDACPVACVIPSYDTGQPGGGDGRPFLLPDRVPCIQCGLCIPACPTGALSAPAGHRT